MLDLNKCELSITIYFHQMNSLSDILMSVRHPLQYKEFIAYLLHGLDSDYVALYECEDHQQLLATEYHIEMRR
jgi:hypothetical protein